MTVTLRFLPNNKTVQAEVGEPLLEVAKRAGISIPTGCLHGSCHACEVDLDDEPVCSCITGVPPSDKEIKVELYSDPTW
jgi:ferredoxin